MNQTYLEHVREAKESLRIWLSNVEQLHNGIKMFSKENDEDRANTEFAKWYYGEGQTFTSFETFKALEPFYDEMYDLFLAYSDLNNKPIKKSFFSSNADKQKSELSIIFLNLRKVGRKLIKSLEIFEEKLENSPLFGGSFEYENKVNNTIPDSISIELDNKESSIETSQEEPQIDALKETVEDLKATIDKVETQHEATQNEINFERRLQEEVAKIKEKLEAEFKAANTEAIEKETPIDAIAEKVVTSNADTPNTDASNPKSSDTITKNSEETNSESTNNDNEIDLDEEIRRILS